jgi:hypothetical protein
MAVKRQNQFIDKVFKLAAWFSLRYNSYRRQGERDYIAGH